MTVFDLISRDIHFKKKAYSYLLLASLSGLCNALVLIVVNFSANHVSNAENSGQTLYLLVLFIMIIAVYSLSQQQLMKRMAYQVEQTLNGVRLSIISRVQECDWNTIEKIDRERIYITLSKELETISQSSMLFVTIGQLSIVLLSVLLYVLWLSIVGFIVLVICFSVGLWCHFHRVKKASVNIENSFMYENRMIARLSDILNGFREVKLNRNRASAILSSYSNDSDEYTESKKKVHLSYTNNLVSSQITYFCLLGAIVFIIPTITTLAPDVLFKVLIALLFLIGPISSIVTSIPTYTNVNAAAKHILQLEADLASQQTVRADAGVFNDFKEIKLDGVSFSHKTSQGEKLFEVGPLDFSLKKGQTIIITGGNGSGKTTFIHLLAGLYHPEQGTITIDGKPVVAAKLDAFRNLFTSVFSDFHLFQQLYGIEGYAQQEADEWFELLEICDKTHLDNNRFTNIDLSSGQKKRLALLSCILENRPIFILDEWAAGQDPQFRAKFYHQVLPRLKAAGKTIVAISHDDRYFHLADTHIKMADGKIIEVNESDPNSALNITPDHTENKDN